MPSSAERGLAHNGSKADVPGGDAGCWRKVLQKPGQKAQSLWESLCAWECWGKLRLFQRDLRAA